MARTSSEQRSSKKTARKRLRVVPRSMLVGLGLTGAAVVPVLWGCQAGSTSSSSSSGTTSSGSSNGDLGVAANMCDVNPNDPRCLGVGAPAFCQQYPNDPSCIDSGRDGEGGDSSSDASDAADGDG